MRVSSIFVAFASFALASGACATGESSDTDRGFERPRRSETSDGGGGGGDPGDQAEEGDGDPDAEPNPCGPTECFVGDECVEAGTLDPADACEVCLPTTNPRGFTADTDSPACDGKPYWEGVAHAFPVTPYGRKTAVSCHNCYALGSSGADSLAKTLAKVHDAQAKGADLIELDIKEEGGVVYVEHDDTGGTRGALFEDVLADAALKAGSQLLFIESKEKTASEPYVRAVLEALKANGYAKAGRPVVLRAFDDVSENIAIARKLLVTPELASMRPHVRLHVLFRRADGNDVAALQGRVKDAKDKGFHGVELEYQTPNIFSALTYAERLDLGTNVWTIPVSLGEVFVTTLRDEVDAITVDYPIDKARAVVQDKNGLMYLNTWKQPAAASSVTWFQRSGSTPSTLVLGAAGRPSLVSDGSGKALFGTSLRFAGAQAAPLYDADNDPNDGYLVSTVATFDNPIPADGKTSVLVGKANASGFSLELFNPAGGGDSDTVLRFGVRVNGKYEYATYPATKLKPGSSYWITGAYDGNGRAWIWVDNSSADSTRTGELRGGVEQNDDPIVLGADPEPDGSTRFYFTGNIQMALVQKWADH